MIVIQMLYTQGWLELAKVVIPNIVNYCRKHNYSWNIQCISEPYDGFEKIRQLQKCFENKECDVVVSMDCDAAVTNYGIKIEQFLDSKNDAYFATDINWINAGVFIVKKSAWSETFLKMLLGYQGQEGMECEQNAIDRYIKTNGLYKIKLINESCFNDFPLTEYFPSYGKWGFRSGDIVERPKNDWKESSFIVHVPGLPFEQRLSILKNTPIQNA